MITNDMAMRPAKPQITIKDTNVTYYSPTSSDLHHHHVRCTQAHMLRVPAISSVNWPGEHLEMPIPNDLEPDISLAHKPRPDYSKHNRNCPRPHIVKAVAGRVRILNDTTEPETIARHEHFFQVHQTRSPTSSTSTHNHCFLYPSSSTANHASATVSVDPENMLSKPTQHSFRSLLEIYYDVFDPTITGYNGDAGPFIALLNMGPVQRPKRKGRLQQYPHDNLVELQQKFDDLEAQGVFHKAGRY